MRKLSFLLLAAFLIGCGGGGGGGGTPAAPGAPASLTANPGDNVVTLTWTSSSGATSYNVYYSTSAGVTKSTGTPLIGSTSPRVVAGLTNGTTYFFVVTAVNGIGESLESGEKSATPTATPPPGIPENVRATAGINQATVSWDSVPGAASYNIYYRTTAGVTTLNGTPLTGATSPQVVAGLANGTTYYFVVTAVNANGQSGISVEVSATPAAAPPPLAPGGVSATPGNAQVSVSWSLSAGAATYNLYYSTAPGVTKGTGVKITGVVSPRIVSPLINGTTYYFVVTAVSAGGESTESAQVSAAPVAPPGGFSQSDITGTWDVVGIQSGGGAGWFRATGVFDASGNVTSITNFRDSTGETDPGPLTLRWTLDAAGVVSESDNNVNTGAHGKMSSDKKLISWTGPQDPSTVQMTIARKRTGAAFVNGDLANVQYAYHALTTGADNNWEYGAGHTNISRQLTTDCTVLPPSYPAPFLPGPNYDTISVSAAGIVTLANDTTFYGLLTDDKRVIFAISNDGFFFRLGVITVTGQTFLQADHAGTIPFAAVRNSAPNSTWAYGVGSINASGNGTYLSYVDSLGGPTPPAYTRNLSATGVITDPADASFHGQMSYNKDLTVQTDTRSTNHYGITIGVR